MSSTVRVALVVAVLAGGCSVGAVANHGPDGGSAEPASLDELVLTTVRDNGFRGADFVQINRAAYPTQLATGEQVNLYVDVQAAALYRRIHPEATGAGVTLPQGSLIVREVLDGSVRTKLTVMAKGAPGYFPAGGDWYYAVLSADGASFIGGDDGSPIHGASATCKECHDERTGDDFLFGVPAAATR